MLKVIRLFIYPVKSLGGIELNSALLEERGLQYDRRWMLIDENNVFLSQRTVPQMALLQTAFTENGLKIFHKENQIITPLHPDGERVTVHICDDSCEALHVSGDCDAWFSEMLNVRCRLVYMPENSRRKVDINYADNNEITSFADGYPLLMIGQSSLDDLNSRLSETLPVNRFRPNIVFTGGNPFEEDELSAITINHILFKGVKLCARCVITTINQANGTKGSEPLKTLADYRNKNNKIYFGQNLLHYGKGIINIGDVIEIVERKQPLINFQFALLSGPQ